MSEKRNAYHVLGLKKGATEQEIKEAYKLLARRHHPDRNQGDPGAQARFIEIKEAYEELIEKKTSTNELLVRMEEKGHEIRRSGVITRIAIGLGAAFVVFALGVAAWQFHFKDLALHQGVAAALAGDLETARAKLEPLAKSRGPNANEARDALVWAILRLARTKHAAPSEAIALEQQALAMLGDATDALGLAIKGDILLRNGDAANAQKAWRAARAASDADAEIYARALAGHLRANSFSEAEAVANEIAKRFPDSPWARWAATVQLLRKRRVDEIPDARDGDPAAVRAAHGAAQTAKARTTADPKERSPRLSQARAKLHGLIEEIERARQKPDHIEFYFGFLWLQPPIRQENPYDWMPSLGIEDPAQAVRLAAASVVDRGNTQGAIELTDKGKGYDSRAYHAQLFYADLLLRTGGMLDRARDTFEQVEKTASWKPVQARAAAGMAKTWAAVGRASGSKLLARERQEEIAAWKRARSLDPSQPEIALGLALAYAAHGNHKDRAAIDRETIKTHPSFGLARLDLGLALHALGKEKDAIAELERAAKIEDSRALALLNLGHIHYDRRRQLPALQAYNQVTKIGSPEDRATAWFRMACLYSLGKDREAAKKAWAEAQSVGQTPETESTALSSVRIDISDPALDWVRPHLARAPR